MGQYNSFNVKLSNTQLNKLRPGIKMVLKYLVILIMRIIICLNCN